MFSSILLMMEVKGLRLAFHSNSSALITRDNCVAAVSCAHIVTSGLDRSTLDPRNTSINLLLQIEVIMPQSPKCESNEDSAPDQYRRHISMSWSVDGSSMRTGNRFVGSEKVLRFQIVS
jgi:hypothetical protein